MKSKNITLAVLAVVLVISVGLAIGTYYINYWPGDSHKPYVPTASQLFELDHFSQMHENHTWGLSRLNMRGKEALILGIAVMQKILQDTKSLYPNILLLIIAHAVSSFLVYWIMTRAFDQKTGLLTFALFVTSAWPYMYIILGAHQPLVLMFFLLSCFCLQNILKNPMFSLGFGVSLGMMLFSSPTAVIYLPYLLFFILYEQEAGTIIKKKVKKTGRISYFLLGFSAVFLLFFWPQPLMGLKKFGDFLLQSQAGNHFDTYRNFLLTVVPESVQHRLASDSVFRGAGWIWIFKYIFLIAPAAMLLYVMGLAAMVKIFFRQKKIMFCLLVSLSTPVLVEISQVSQIGRNYFSWYIGILFIIGLAWKYVRDNKDRIFHKTRKKLYALASALICLHVGLNLFNFFGDIYPSRMATATIDQWLRDRDVKEVFVYQDHPQNPFVSGVMNNTKRKDKIEFWGINQLMEPRFGYILIPPTTGQTIYGNCAEGDFHSDPYLTKAFEDGLIERMSAASFDNIATSRFWRQEEEVCAYRDLSLGQIEKIDPSFMRIYILDTSKVQDLKDQLFL